MLAATLLNLPKYKGGKVYADNPWKEPRKKEKPKQKRDEVLLLTTH